MTLIIVDSREPEWVRKLTYGGCQVAVSTLPFGDFQIVKDDGSIIIIERKTGSDLLGSIADGRLLKQCAGIGQLILDDAEKQKARSVFGLLLITGKLLPQKGMVVTGAGKASWNWASVQGALLTAQSYGLDIYHAETDWDVEKTIISLIKRDFVGDHVVKPTRQFKKLSHTISVLSTLPGIGLQKAIKLSEITNDSLVQSLIILSDPDHKIPGVGPKTRQAIKKALGLASNEYVFAGLKINEEKEAENDK